MQVGDAGHDPAPRRRWAAAPVACDDAAASSMSKPASMLPAGGGPEHCGVERSSWPILPSLAHGRGRRSPAARSPPAMTAVESQRCRTPAPSTACSSAPRWRRSTRPHGYGEIADGALGWRDGLLAFVGPARGAAGRAARARARSDRGDGLDHAGPGRLPYAPGVRRRPRARVRAAPAGRELRRDRARRRRHPVHRARDARGRRRRTAARNRCRARGAARATASTTLEIKSGYGLDFDNERKMLRVARSIGEALGITVRTTYLGGACAAAGIHGTTPTSYIDAAVRLAAAAARRRPGRCGRCVLRRHRLHAGADAARVRGRARARPAGEAARRPAQRPRRRGAGGGIRRPVRRPRRTHHRSTACARWPRTAPSRCCCPAHSTCCAKPSCRRWTLFRAHGVPMAVATDCNPGTSPLLSLRQAMQLACTHFRLTPEEALRGATVHARARARPARSRRAARRHARRLRPLARAASGRAVLLAGRSTGVEAVYAWRLRTVRDLARIPPAENDLHWRSMRRPRSPLSVLALSAASAHAAEPPTPRGRLAQDARHRRHAHRCAERTARTTGTTSASPRPSASSITRARATAGWMSPSCRSTPRPTRTTTARPGRSRNTQIDVVEALAARHPDKFALLRSPRMSNACSAGGKRAARRWAWKTARRSATTWRNVQFFFDRGVRYITLAHGAQQPHQRFVVPRKRASGTG